MLFTDCTAKGWSDQVFTNSCTPEPMEQVEPLSASPWYSFYPESTGKGFDATRFNAKLLMKIEDLTLYMIESPKGKI